MSCSIRMDEIKKCKLVWVPSFVMEMAISVGPDQTGPFRMSFDQGLHCLIWPVRLNIVWVLARYRPDCFFFSSHYYV